MQVNRARFAVGSTAADGTEKPAARSLRRTTRSELVALILIGVYDIRGLGRDKGYYRRTRTAAVSDAVVVWIASGWLVLAAFNIHLEYSIPVG